MTPFFLAAKLLLLSGVSSAFLAPLPRFVYRTIRVGGKEHSRALEGNSIFALRPSAEVGIREHVLRGSGSKWRGSQFVSTTRDLDVAVRFAAPCNPIIRIDLARFQGDAIDLSTNDAFEFRVPPADADLEPGDAAAEKLQFSKGVASDLWSEEENADLAAKDAQWLWEQAAGTPWECARMFATRSKEVLLCGEITRDCYQLLQYKMRTTGIEYLSGHKLPELPPLESIEAWEPCGGNYEGLTSFKVEGQERPFHLKQARANVGPSMLDAAGMRESIDHEFAAFRYYRLVEDNVPSMQVHVRDCAKASFEVLAEGSTWFLNCIVFETIDELRPARVGWRLMDAASSEQVFQQICRSLDVDSQKIKPPSRLSASRKMTATTEELVARWRVSAQLSEEDAVKLTQQYGPGRQHSIYRHIATEFALDALKGVAADIFLANVYGWGVFDKPQLFRCTRSGKLYRMSADTTLGSNGSGIEPLNHDRSETWANLAFLTFFAAANDMPFFTNWVRASAKPRSLDEVGPCTYKEHAGGPLLQHVYKQFELLAALAQDHRKELLEIFECLNMPSDVCRLAAMFPDRAGWMANIEPREYWHSFMCDRLRYARKKLLIARPLTEYESQVEARGGSIERSRTAAAVHLWAGYSVGIRVMRKY